jgi:energy-coupling factor transporter ATP-binding protein EcfA2
MKFVVDPHERTCIIGRTGCGKTEWAKYMLREISKSMPVIIIDPKEDWLGQFPVWETKRKEPGTIDKPHLIKEYNEKFHVQVLQPDEEDDDSLEKLCKEVLKLRNRFIYFDETEGLCTANHVPTGIRRIWKTGRSKGIGAWVSTQTPTGIPRIFKSQADKFVTFIVGSEDVDIAAEIGHGTKDDVKLLKRFEFLYYDTKSDAGIAEWQPPVPFKERVIG